MTKIKINDIVKIVRSGSTYPSYKDMAESMGATIGQWINHDLPKEKFRAKILNIRRISKLQTTYVLIEIIEGSQIGQQFVIGADGLKIDTTSQLIAANILGDDLFEI